jgi:hypothetical protein
VITSEAPAPKTLNSFVKSGVKFVPPDPPGAQPLLLDAVIVFPEESVAVHVQVDPLHGAGVHW